MLSIGAVGAEAVLLYLDSLGHQVLELERGSLGTRIWREVKRKRVRIPDLCCARCGVRIESRAKTSGGLSMSHSTRDAERSWDYGMTDSDWVAFPIVATEEKVWDSGELASQASLWREHSEVSFRVAGLINVFAVSAFRQMAPKISKPKGVTEGSEVQVCWNARFAPAPGRVTRQKGRRVYYVTDPSPERDRYFSLVEEQKAFLDTGERFELNQVVIGQVKPLTEEALKCKGGCDEDRVEGMVRSRERTLRFTGCKLARLLECGSLAGLIREVGRDPEEDPYVRMEAKAYLCEVGSESAEKEFGPVLLHGGDDQMRLEAAVALGETRTQSAFKLLHQVLTDERQPLFLRCACAFGIGRHGTEEAAECLVRAFGDVAREIREEALVALQGFGPEAERPLLHGLSDCRGDVAAGAAEVLRRRPEVPAEEVAELALRTTAPWPTWALAHIPRRLVSPHIARLRQERPEVQYAISVLWAFLESWIAENWTPFVRPGQGGP